MNAATDFYLNFTFQNPLTAVLPTPLNLAGYEAALTFVSFPQQFYNLPAGWVEKQVNGVKTRRTIPSGFYPDVPSLVTVIKAVIDEEGIDVAYAPNTNLVHVNVAENIKTPKSVKFSPVIASALNLPRTIIKIYAKSSTPIYFSGQHQVFYITTNFITPQICNNGMLPVIAAATTGPQPLGRTVSYVAVRQGLLDTVNINIVSPFKQTIRFLSGAVTATIHFRKTRACPTQVDM